MPRKILDKLLFTAYQFFRSLRYSALLAAFGYVSHCKHSPTCGTYFWRCWKERGVKGLPQGLKRLASCW